MHDLIRKYIELTEVDRLMVDTTQQLGRYPAMLARLNADDQRREEEIKGFEEKLEQARHERREAEKEIEGLRERISKYLGQQSQVKTNKEYQAIVHEIDAIRGQIDEWETKGLENLEVEEEAAGRLEEFNANLERQRGANEQERQRIQDQIEEKQGRLETLKREKVQKLAPLDEPDQEEYELINETYPGSAAAPLNDEDCGGCNWKVVPQTQQQVRMGGELVRCEHCRRFLYAPEEIS